MNLQTQNEGLISTNTMPWTQDVSCTYVRRSEKIQDISECFMCVQFTITGEILCIQLTVYTILANVFY